MVTGGSLHSALYFCIFLFFLTTKSWKTKKQQQPNFGELKTLVQFSDLTGDSGAQILSLKDSLKMMLPPARVFTPTESIKLTCVKSRMMVWMLSPGGINLCSSSGSVLDNYWGYLISFPSSSGLVPSSPSTSASYVKIKPNKNSINNSYFGSEKDLWEKN